MDITFLGHSSFKLRGRETSLVTDPFDPEMVGLKFPKISAEIVTISHEHDDHNKSDQVSGVKKVVAGPGEYEISGVSIIGLSTYHDDKKGKLRGKNTIYIVEMDEVKLVHLGDLGHQLSDQVLEKIGDVDVLMIPVGGDYTIGPEVAAEIVRDIEPKAVLPMHYQMAGLKKDVFGRLSSVEHFLSDVGLMVEKMDKLSIRKESFEEEQKVVVLEKR